MYAPRLWPRRSARGPQTPELSAYGFLVLGETSECLCAAAFYFASGCQGYDWLPVIRGWGVWFVVWVLGMH